jgi:guanylate kinase
MHHAKKESAMRPLFTFLGPTGCGKTSIIHGMLVRFAGKVEVVRSITTRDPRDPEDPIHYRFVTQAEVDALKAADALEKDAAKRRIIQGVTYAENFYGNDRADVDGVLSRVCGLNAMTEEGVINFRKQNYDVRVIKVIPIGKPDARSAERRKADLERATMYRDLPVNFTVANEFVKGSSIASGLAVAIDRVAMWLEPQLKP